jgi:hypothetical protein
MQHPLFETGAGRMQTIIDGCHRQPEESGNVLVRAFADEKQRGGLAQRIRQF